MARKRYFEWLDGELKGEVSILESITEFDGETFYNFEEDSCNLRYISKMTSNVLDLRGKIMVEVENPHNIWTFRPISTSVPKDVRCDGNEEIPTLHDIIHSDGSTIEKSNYGSDELVPPRRPQTLRNLPDPKDYKAEDPVIEDPAPDVPTQAQDDVPAPVQVQEPELREDVVMSEGPEETAHQAFQYDGIDLMMPECDAESTSVSVFNNIQPKSPVEILVGKCKKHEYSIPLEITANLPAKALYDIANEEFENGGDAFINCIVSEIDISDIISALKDALKSAYSSPEKTDMIN